VRRPALVIMAVALAGVALAGQPHGTRVSLLSAGPRDSIVVEFPDPVAVATEVKDGDPGMFVVDFGPMAAPVVPGRFQAGPDVRLVREVIVSNVSLSTGGTALRVEVKLRAPAPESVRLAGKRAYIDFTAQDVTRAPIIASGRQPAPVAAVPTTGDADSEVTTRALEPRPRSDDEWRKSLLHRAESLAQAPDVRGLEALRRELLREVGPETPGAIRPSDHGRDAALLQLDEYLAQARQRQLAVDGRLLRQAQTEKYRDELLSAAAVLDRMERALLSRQPAVDPDAALDATAAELAFRITSLDAPTDLAAAHTSLRTRLQEVVTAIAAQSTAPGNLRATRILEATASIARARSVVTDMLVTTSSR
jgi:hypothetical protein